MGHTEKKNEMLINGDINGTTSDRHENKNIYTEAYTSKLLYNNLEYSQPNLVNLMEYEDKDFNMLNFNDAYHETEDFHNSMFNMDSKAIFSNDVLAKEFDYIKQLQMNKSGNTSNEKVFDIKTNIKVEEPKIISNIVEEVPNVKENMPAKENEILNLELPIKNKRGRKKGSKIIKKVEVKPPVVPNEPEKKQVIKRNVNKATKQNIKQTAIKEPPVKQPPLKQPPVQQPHIGHASPSPPIASQMPVNIPKQPIMVRNAPPPPFHHYNPYVRREVRGYFAPHFTKPQPYNMHPYMFNRPGFKERMYTPFPANNCFIPDKNYPRSSAPIPNTLPGLLFSPNALNMNYKNTHFNPQIINQENIKRMPDTTKKDPLDNKFQKMKVKRIRRSDIRCSILYKKTYNQKEFLAAINKFNTELGIKIIPEILGKLMRDMFYFIISNGGCMKILPDSIRSPLKIFAEYWKNKEFYLLYVFPFEQYITGAEVIEVFFVEDTKSLSYFLARKINQIEERAKKNFITRKVSQHEILMSLKYGRIQDIVWILNILKSMDFDGPLLDAVLDVYFEIDKFIHENYSNANQTHPKDKNSKFSILSDIQITALREQCLDIIMNRMERIYLKNLTELAPILNDAESSKNFKLKTIFKKEKLESIIDSLVRREDSKPNTIMKLYQLKLTSPLSRAIIILERNYHILEIKDNVFKRIHKKLKIAESTETFNSEQYFIFSMLFKIKMSKNKKKKIIRCLKPNISNYLKSFINLLKAEEIIDDKGVYEMIFMFISNIKSYKDKLVNIIFEILKYSVSLHKKGVLATMYLKRTNSDVFSILRRLVIKVYSRSVLDEERIEVLLHAMCVPKICDIVADMLACN